MKQLLLIITLFFSSTLSAQTDITPFSIGSFADSCGIANDTFCVAVKNFDTSSNTYSLTLKITGDTSITTTNTGLIISDSGAIDTVKFSNVVLNTINGGTYYIEAITNLAGDPVALNDTLRDTFSIYPIPDCNFKFSFIQDNLEVTFEATIKDTNNIYNWSFGDGSVGGGDSVTYTYLLKNEYYVSLTVTNPMGCECISYDTVNLLNSVKRLYNSDVVKIYPNPSNGVFALEFKEPGLNGNVAIYNSIGRQVYYEEQVEGRHPIDISNLPKGIYSIAVHSGGRVYTYKINIIK